MKERLLAWSDRWFHLLLRLYPIDFREDMGNSVVETYRDRAREAYARRGVLGIASVWIRALVDTLRNGPGERVTPAVSWRRTGQWARDAEFATRRLRRSPALVLAVVSTLTIGLGMFAVVYTVVYKILVAPLPYRNPHDLYVVWRDYGPIFDLKRGWLAGTDVAELQKAGGDIEAAVGVGRALMTFSLNEGSDPTEIAVIQSTPNLFDVLGVAPTIGRGFAPHEVGPARVPTVVLTHQLWNRLGADPSIVGRDVRLNGAPVTVIGVMARDFSFVRNASLGPPQRADAFMTFPINLAETNPNGGSYGGLIRVRPGTPPESVASSVDRVGRLIDTRDFEGRGLRLWPAGLQPDLVASVRPALVVVALAGVFLLLALMVNLASMLLARAAQREREMAVSRALGASRVAIARATLFEGGILGLLGAIAGTVAAAGATRTLLTLAPLDLPRRDNVAVDWQVAAVVIGAGLALGLLASTPPAVWAARTSLGTLLARAAVRGGGGGHNRTRRVLVVAQVALSLVLLTTGGLVVRSFDRLLRADPGFRPDGVLAFRVPLPVQFYRETPQAIAVQDRIESALGSLPGVTGASATVSLPLLASANQTTIGIPGAPGNTGDADKDRPLVDWIGIRASYPEVLGMRLVAGRPFQTARRADVREALIDTNLMRQFFPTGSPLGAKIPFLDTELTIVGVVEQARLYDVHEDGRPQLYVRAEDGGFRSLAWVVRTTRLPDTIIPEVRAAIRGIDPRLAIADEKSMTQIVSDAIRPQRASAVLIASFALGALLLASMGLFGVVSGAVTRRRHEFAIRMALGADHPQVLRLVLGDGARLILVGLLLGAPGIYAASGIVRGALVGVSPLDPATVSAVALGLAVVAILACYLPARRVLRIEPAQSLRDQ
jgi:predicted permease